MHIDWDLLQKYLAGDCTGDERTRFEAWLAKAPMHRQILHEMRELAAEPDREVLPERQEALLADLKQRIAGPPPLRLVPRLEPRVRVVPLESRPRRMNAMKAAAIGALVLGVGTTAYFWQSTTSSTERTTAVATRVATTPAGQRAVFDLPDGTRVMLGVASRLEYPAEFGRSRDVRLEGEAYFEVVHDERHPFVVRAGDLVATDLGTQFVVRAYAEDGHARVVVREGRVAIGTTAAPGGAQLVPGQMGRLSPTGNPIVEPADTAAAFAWTTGTLVLTRTALAEALPQISRWFDLDFRLTDPTLGRRTIAATLTTRPTDDALAALAAAVGLHATRQGRVVTFSRQ